MCSTVTNASNASLLVNILNIYITSIFISAVLAATKGPPKSGLPNTTKHYRKHLSGIGKPDLCGAFVFAKTAEVERKKGVCDAGRKRNRICDADRKAEGDRIAGVRCVENWFRSRV